jgi:hypothetical protein
LTRESDVVSVTEMVIETRLGREMLVTVLNSAVESESEVWRRRERESM